jgi:hypothetical protein
MATTYRTLGQVSASTSVTAYVTLFSVPSTSSAIVSNIVACNLTASAQTIRIACTGESGAPTSAQFIAYDVTVPANDSLPLVMGVTLDNGVGGDNIRYIKCSASSGSVSFSAFGAIVT